MKIIHQNGKILSAVYDSDWFKFEDNSVNSAIIEIEEIENNKALCIDLIKKFNSIDDAGDPKYSVVNGVVTPKSKWTEKIETL